MKLIHKQFATDWSKYIKLTKKQYDKPRKLTEEQLKKLKNIYKPGELVLYYCGDIQRENRKWHQRWSGPWSILERVDARTVIISDQKEDVKRRASIDRIKYYHADLYYELDEYNKIMFDRIDSNDRDLKLKQKSRYKYVWKP